MTAVRWIPAETPEGLADLPGLPSWCTPLLARRGVSSSEAAAAFLTPSLDHLHDPLLMAGMEEAAARLALARRDGAKVAVVGDYDTDGITATALLVSVLGACGLEAAPILPHRLLEGYGFQPIHVDKARQLGCKLIVTVDCGTSSGAAVETAVRHGLDVLVTDHHLPGDALPGGAIQINPRREECRYPFPDLSGAGVAMKLSMALAQRLGRPLSAAPLLRLACLGTIADLVPLVGENRVIAALGLASLARTRSLGLRALMERSGIRGRPRASDVGFRLAPRLNAAGRLASGEQALALLLTRNRDEATRIADELEQRNRERQVEEARVVEGARQRLQRDDSPVLLAWDPDWHRGVLGIAAGRLARELHRPVILFQMAATQAVGSARSVPGLDLHAFLAGWRDEYVQFGGHAQAAGLTVSASRLPALAAAWRAEALRWPTDLLAPRYEYELSFSGDEIDAELLATLDRLEPFGQGNPSPLVRVGPLTVVGKPRNFGRGHTSGLARTSRGRPLTLLGWGWAERSSSLRGEIEVLGRIEEDRMRQGPLVRLVDCRPPEAGE